MQAYADIDDIEIVLKRLGLGDLGDSVLGELEEQIVALRDRTRMLRRAVFEGLLTADSAQARGDEGASYRTTSLTTLAISSTYGTRKAGSGKSP